MEVGVGVRGVGVGGGLGLALALKAGVVGVVAVLARPVLSPLGRVVVVGGISRVLRGLVVRVVDVLGLGLRLEAA